MLKMYAHRTDSIIVRFYVDEARVERDDLSGSTYSAELRSGKSPTSPLIFAFEVDASAATDGELVLSVDDSAWSGFDDSVRWAYFDVKRTTDGEPYAMCEYPIHVEIVGSPTS